LISIGSYQVKIQTQSGEEKLAVLCPATAEDMPNNWTCAWSSFWQNTDFNCQGIIKLVYVDQIWGLVRYGLYPYPGVPKFLEIENLEAHPRSRGELTKRSLSPIGKWLIWYCINVALQCCTVTENAPLVILVSLENAMSYYRDVIQMEYCGSTTIAPGEDGYAFRFSPTAAAAFCQRHENEWGIPNLCEQ
jgi:hypothetical protein